MRSNVTRGLIATGSGLVSSRHDSVLKNAHGKPSQAPAGGAHVLGADLERAQRRVAGDLVGDVLVDASSSTDLAERVAGAVAAPPGRRRSGTRRWRPRCTDSPHGAFMLADGHELRSRYGLERLHHRLELEVAPVFVGCHVLREDAVRHVHRAEAERRAAAVRAWAVSAGTIASRNGSATAAPNAPRRNVRRDRCFLVMNMATPSLCSSCGC